MSDGYALNTCCLQSGFPSQFYFSLPCCCKLAELMQPLMGSCEIIACPREKIRLPVDGLLGVQCLHCVLWPHSKKGQKIFIKRKCLQNTACKCLPPAAFSLRFSSISEGKVDWNWQNHTKILRGSAQKDERNYYSTQIIMVN